MQNNTGYNMQKKPKKMMQRKLLATRKFWEVFLGHWIIDIFINKYIYRGEGV